MALLHYRGARARARLSGSLLRTSNIQSVIDPIKRALAPAGLRQRSARLDQRLLLVGQIAWIAELRSYKLKFPSSTSDGSVLQTGHYLSNRN